jgi:hypothetical protein
MNHIFRNFSKCEGYSEDSFLGKFHENNIWDDDEYFKLEEAIFEVSKEYQGMKNIPRDIAWPLMQIYSYLMISLGCHFDENDGFEIKNITHDQFHARRERVKLVFEGFFSDEMPNRKYLGY